MKKCAKCGVEIAQGSICEECFIESVEGQYERDLENAEAKDPHYAIAARNNLEADIHTLGNVVDNLSITLEEYPEVVSGEDRMVILKAVERLLGIVTKHREIGNEKERGSYDHRDEQGRAAPWWS